MESIMLSAIGEAPLGLAAMPVRAIVTQEESIGKKEAGCRMILAIKASMS